MTSPLGEALAHAVAAKDHGRVRALLHSDVDVRGMTPSRVCEATDPHGVARDERIGWLRTTRSGFRSVAT